LRDVWAAVETLRRTNPKLKHVDKACGAFARKGYVEYHSQLGATGTAWASGSNLKGTLGRVSRVLRGTRVEVKHPSDAAESFRKMYDHASELRKRDAAFRATSDNILRNNLILHHHRDALSRADVTLAEMEQLANPGPDEAARILALYPEPKKFRIRRRAPG
jgi:hypothetical protein